ncbi:MAG TPA: hypothetical protein VGJ13_10730 [Pseudonocardiaceae bacterium]
MEYWKRRLGVIVASAALAGGGVLGAATSAYATDAGGPSHRSVIGHSQDDDWGYGNQLNQDGQGNQANQGGGGYQSNQGGGNQLNQRGGSYTTWQYGRWIWIPSY